MTIEYNRCNQIELQSSHRNTLKLHARQISTLGRKGWRVCLTGLWNYVDRVAWCPYYAYRILTTSGRRVTRCRFSIADRMSQVSDFNIHVTSGSSQYAELVSTIEYVCSNISTMRSQTIPHSYRIGSHTETYIGTYESDHRIIQLRMICQCIVMHCMIVRWCALHLFVRKGTAVTWYRSHCNYIC